MSHDPVQRLVARARTCPHLCVFCQRQKDALIDLRTFDDSGSVVEVDERNVPTCATCLVGFLAFAGSRAILKVQL